MVRRMMPHRNEYALLILSANPSSTELDMGTLPQLITQASFFTTFFELSSPFLLLSTSRRQHCQDI